MNYTTTQYNALQNAFDFFNKKLFSDTLQQVMINIVRKKNAKGYFWGDSMKANETTICEIALNPEMFSRPEEEIFSTLVHEMVHLWQHQYGQKKPKNAYHNKEWANKMEEVGLMPSTDGTPNGAKTGKQCTHYIITNGKFTKAYNEMPDAIKIIIKGIIFLEIKKKKSDNKVCYTCESCEAKVWGKSGLLIQCVDCEQNFTEAPEEDA